MAAWRGGWQPYGGCWRQLTSASKLRAVRIASIACARAARHLPAGNGWRIAGWRHMFLRGRGVPYMRLAAGESLAP
jgi:hypothetical protein